MKGMKNMYNPYNKYPCQYYNNTPWFNPNMMYDAYKAYQHYMNGPMYNREYSNQYNNQYYTNKPNYDWRYNNWQNPMNNNGLVEFMDYGPESFVINIEEATKQNNTYRIALWTGDYLQLTLMSIDVGEDIGLEMHPDVDQFIRIEEGQGLVRMGDREDRFDFEENVYDDFAFIIPAGKWHNLINTGNTPIKLYSIYAPPEHPHSTVHETKAEAEAAERNHRY